MNPNQNYGMLNGRNIKTELNIEMALQKLLRTFSTSIEVISQNIHT